MKYVEQPLRPIDPYDHSYKQCVMHMELILFHLTLMRHSGGAAASFADFGTYLSSKQPI